MSSELIQATFTSCALTAMSNLLAQFITAYRKGAGWSSSTIEWTPVFQFAVYASLSSPLNFQWQEFLEGLFPGETLQPRKLPISAAGSDYKKDLENDPSYQKRLNIPNTIMKFAMDQIIGNALNTFALSLAMAGFRGEDWREAILSAKKEFWPLTIVGLQVWPLFSLICYMFIRTVKVRTLVGNLAGMGWLIYTTIVASEN